MEEAVFYPNPFLRKAFWYEQPKQIITDHWVTKEFGFEVFKSANPAKRWFFIVVGDKLFQATPEF